MAEAQKTPTKRVASHVCRTCNDNIILKNHPIHLFGSKLATDENIVEELERFSGFKITQNDGLPSHICRVCQRKVKKFQDFFRVMVKSRQQQESVLRVKRGKSLADSPSASISPSSRREPKKGKVAGNTCSQQTPPNVGSPRVALFQVGIASTTRQRPILPVPSANTEGRKRKLPPGIAPEEPKQQLSKQEEVLMESGLRNPLVQIIY